MPDDVMPTLDEQLCFAVYAAGHAFNRAYKPLLAELGLTYPQYLVMLLLWQQDDQPVKALGSRLDLDSGTLTPLLKRLEHAGLVVRRRDRDDERSVRITLTEQGRGLREKARRVPAGIACAVGGEPAEAARLREELVALRQRLDAAARRQAG